jgi:hypothetical protein
VNQWVRVEQTLNDRVDEGRVHYVLDAYTTNHSTPKPHLVATNSHSCRMTQLTNTLWRVVPPHYSLLDEAAK